LHAWRRLDSRSADCTSILPPANKDGDAEVGELALERADP
jgi:hypothetical protein